MVYKCPNICMKRLSYYLMLTVLFIGMTLPVAAQNRRATKPADQNALKYEVRAKSVFVGQDYIYYVEDNNNNAVMGIDRKTGDVKTIVPGIANVYEGARPTIRYCMEFGGKLILETQKNGKSAGVYVYDGGSLQSSLLIEKSLEIIDCNKKYMLVKCEKGFDAEGVVMDINMQVKVRYNMNMHRGSYHVDDNGAVWCWNAYGLAISNGRNLLQYVGRQSFDYDLTRIPYVAQAYQDNEYDTNIECATLKDGYIYVAIARRLYRRDIKGEQAWEEVLKVPATENNKFRRFIIDPKGNILTQGDVSENYNTQLWMASDYSSPQNLGEYFTYKTSKVMGGYDKIWWSLLYGLSDADGNFVFHDKGTYITSIFVYNPKGLVGYSNTKGKVIDLNK